jgi:hypothetical protein
VTFNHYGERGSIDILAWHPGERMLVVAEVKTVIVDAQELLAGIDRKTRVAAMLARRNGRRPAAVLPALLVREGATSATDRGARAAVRSVQPRWTRGPGLASAAGKRAAIAIRPHLLHAVVTCPFWRP